MIDRKIIQIEVSNPSGPQGGGATLFALAADGTIWAMGGPLTAAQGKPSGDPKMGIWFQVPALPSLY
jgi:hypothetical protein